jgi:hypothetical protein
MIHGGLHLKVYDEFFNLSGGQKARRCEIMGTYGAEIAHIDAAGMGGRESAHVIENLMGLNRILHIHTEGQPRYKQWLRKAHLAYMETQVPWVEAFGYDDPIFRELYLVFYTEVNKNR